MSVCLSVYSEQSGCQIRLEEPKPGSTQRIITIIGHQSSIPLAQSLLQSRFVCAALVVCACLLGGMHVHTILCLPTSVFASSTLFSARSSS